MTDYDGQVAVVTGAASGIGLALARELGQRGARVVLSDIEHEALRVAAETLQSEGIEAYGEPVDVADITSMNRLADDVFSRFGEVNFVAHNAGVVYYGDISRMKTSDWAWLINVNLWGPINGVSAFLPRMLDGGARGHMLFTASMGGLATFAETGGYCATKFGVVALAEGLELENRQNDKIGFSVLCPMHVSTNISHSNRNRPPELGGASANSEAVALRKGGVHSSVLSAQSTAKLTLDAIGRGEFYVQTHQEGRPLAEARMARILSSFDVVHGP